MLVRLSKIREKKGILCACGPFLFWKNRLSRLASLTRLLLSMYKRPNAPFRPPRPLSAAKEVSKLDAAGSEDPLFVTDTTSCHPEVPCDLLQAETSKLTETTRPHIAPFKRAKPNPALVRRKAASTRVPDAQDSPTKTPNMTPSLRQTSLTDSQENLLLRDKRYFSIQWRKRSNKKNKSWEGDGFIVATDVGLSLRVQLADGSYKLMGRTKNTALDGVISIGMYEVEIDCETTREELFGAADSASAESPIPSTAQNPDLPPSSNAFKHHIIKRESTFDETDPEMPSNDAFQIDPPRPAQVVVRAAESLVLPDIGISGSKVVIVDERLTRFLRQHQKEGVIFLYECLMGLRNTGHFGGLLADEMGLGKTLMTITLIWTLLKQSPFPNQRNVVSKVLICCPVSLIDNWRKEFGKWLDINRIGILALNNKNQSVAKDKQDILNFGKTKVYQVLIMNYEKVLACSNELSTVNIDLLVCDEGHRLKSAANKVLKYLNGMPTKKRLILTGTPIQNDLGEFYNISNFINPGLFGTMSDFQKDFIRPILRARDVNCYDALVAQHGKEKLTLLIELTKTFTIRRTKSVIENYLTAKTDVLLFCPPTKLQKTLFQFVIDSVGFNSLSHSGTREALPTINLLRKICNSPSLLSDDSFYRSLVDKCESCPSELLPSSLSSRTTGSKINIAIPLLLNFRTLGENVVIVSNFTLTLDLLEKSLSKLNFQYARLDGSTPLATRDSLVTSFNKSKKYEVFLLSAKAGGIGLNLVGASRLLLFDNDWNPLVDLQAMARIHRDGQRRPVFIYRLFTTGSIDEKIFQRQLMKSSLSDMFLDDNPESTLDIFDFDDLRDLFTVGESNCNTHDLIDCSCSGKGDETDLLPAVANPDESCIPDDKSQGLSQEILSHAHRTSSSGWMSALEYKELEGSDSVKRKAIRSALSHYRHFDPKHYEDEFDTGDDILNKLIPRAQEDLTYILTHQTKGAICD
ncbi:DNA repair and recombination protein RAD54B [Metschnikowia aff. pulcherrima]|uniref:DNA repair and recombination protein RAD54B n=1 Tax=Metschnikowia aff. pulcherrima TaxID=2163413 RepID=A0A4P6XSA7_9ASCO|nr:DNA repair and recombination protein RAD54B [Metschnikowia aff. pulcherrima]